MKEKPKNSLFSGKEDWQGSGVNKFGSIAFGITETLEGSMEALNTVFSLLV